VAASSKAGVVTAEAAHGGYRRLRGRPVHSCRWSLTCAGLPVDCEVTGYRRHEVATRSHLAPWAALPPQDDGTVVSTTADDVAVRVAASSEFDSGVEAGMVATGFMRTTVAPVLSCLVDSALLVQPSTRWRRMPGETRRAT
jgi:hypothetical protein